MSKINGISADIVEDLLQRARQLGQGRSAAVIGLLDNNNIISARTAIINGGSGGIPYRKLLSSLNSDGSCCLLELLNRLPDEAVIISIKPGKTGIIVSTNGINLFDLPVVKIGFKSGNKAGIGILKPRKELFKLASESERVSLKSLAALSMEEEKQALRESAELHLKYLDIGTELQVKKVPARQFELGDVKKSDWSLPEIPEVKSIDRHFARSLVEKSIAIEQGREVAAVGKISTQGHVTAAGKLVVGGMGYIPSRLLASSYQDIGDISLRKAYTEVLPANCIIVHTHPGGTGVMHLSDAMAGPGTWGRPIAAIGHTEKAEIKGVHVIVPEPKLFKLADEREELEQKFFNVESSTEEVKLRKQRYQIAQKFTDLCREITLK